MAYSHQSVRSKIFFVLNQINTQIQLVALCIAILVYDFPNFQIYVVILLYAYDVSRYLINYFTILLSCMQYKKIFL